MPYDEGHIRAIAERVAASSGLEIVDLELRGGGKARVLRVFIEKNSESRHVLEQQLAGEHVASARNWDQLAGVTHEDCANFSREMGTILDVEDAVPGGEYLLEVSSPGLDRKLVKPADYQRFAGSMVKVLTREPVGGNRHFEGRLQAGYGGRIRLDLDIGRKQGKHKRAREADGAGHTIELEMSNIERARLVPEF